MPCGQKPVVKVWDRPKDLKNIKQSRYQKNEASVKQHWRQVMVNLEMLYKDDKFWETQSPLVRELVGEVIYERLTKIFNLPKDKPTYEPPEEDVEVEPSENFYDTFNQEDQVQNAASGDMSLYELNISDEVAEEEGEEEQSEWSASSLDLPQGASRSKIIKSSKSVTGSKSEVIQIGFSKSKMLYSRHYLKSMSQKILSKSRTVFSEPSDEDASSDDDVIVHPVSLKDKKRRSAKNPHFELLYCNESETDMIKWNSKYKQKKFEVSASDEFSKKAQIATKLIAHNFYEWWISNGSSEYKSEIKRPEDIEDLFQVWFDEHASRGLVLDPKIMPCVLESIAKFVRVPKAACSKVLGRQIAFDVHAETSPKHTRAFNTSLPKHLRHIPPKNNTKEIWKHVDIPEDLRTMSCVFAETSHLTSTKSFREWLQHRPYLAMPQYFKTRDSIVTEKKQRFVVPSDFYVRGSIDGESSTQEFNLPVSQFSLETKEVLSRLLRDQ